MKRILIIAMAALAVIVSSCGHKYETVKGDPLKTKIYTLDNGLKVYMSVNKEEPRIQTYIAVRSGGRNDPADNTGLAHYLEHLMFKGSESLGTTDYAAEKPILDQIEDLYEVYRTKTDPAERRAIYRVIDSLSYEASKISIPNEYDKSMAIIGAIGTNAFTSNDVTCYTEDIPSNQIENWAKVQSDRFKNMVIRGFHTELETVYEEYNMYLNEDSENAMMAIDSVLFKNHPYGTQTVIGTSDHLKNPSIKAIKKQKATYYVPNNCAICVSGDFDPDEFVKIVEKYFGDWEPNPDLPVFSCEPEEPITAPVEKEVFGTEAEFVMIAWRYPGEAVIESEMADIVDAVLNNGMAGIIDLDLNQQQKVLAAESQAYSRTDYSEFIVDGYPKQGQTLEEVRDLLLASVAKLRSGDFDENLVKASVANFKLRQMRSIERNSSRAMSMVNSFIAGHEWKDDVKQLDRFSKVTKQDIVDWANEYLGENSYVVAYKRVGLNPRNEKIVAPEITPIATNRDKQSDFLTELQASEVKPIEPVFVDYDKDMSVFTLPSGIEVLYKHNDINDIATVQFLFDEGALSDPALSLATDYVSYLGSETRTAEEIASEMYALACSNSLRSSTAQTSYSVTGLSENIGKALDIMEDLIANAEADEEVLTELKADMLQSRAVNKLTQRSCNSALNNYVMYGPEFIRSTTLTNDQLAALSSGELLAKVTNLLTKQHKVLYYGPMSENEVRNLLAEHHNVAGELEPLVRKYPEKVLTSEPKVIIAPYDARQFNYIQYSDRGEKFVIEDAPAIEVFNEYFGGGMNTIVFQEMREARALAYSASAYLNPPAYGNDSYCFYARIGSQNDKLQTAVEAFDEIINNMPESQKAFDIAMSSLEGTLRTQRTTGMSVLNSYLNSKELGLKEPLDKYIFGKLGDITLEDLTKTQQKWVKDRTYVYGILGDASGLDLNFLKTLGPVQQVTLEDIFGY
ncbi:MAG: insulinase family protein [Bacteroidales bacterium]|nr:insulinase family protein [Bacteroidales bacterium]